MSVASARLSPAANLLRNSRLFAVPAPLPSPPLFVTSQSLSDSDTATQPYPTYAAIETSQLNRRKGDWGLKRPLPAKLSRKQAIRAIRIRGGIDTIEHIADYESAGDHTINLQKWQALHIPILKPPQPEAFSESGAWRYDPGGPGSSVFEDQVDNTIKREQKDARRWRFQGPWLQGMSGLEFEGYLKEVRSKKEQFREHLRGRMAATKLRRLKEQAQNQGEILDEKEAEIVVTEDELQEYIKSLRERPEEFNEIMSIFLDIPEGPKANTAQMTRKGELSSDEYALSGPPKTHPSAGLSYLRSNAYVINHPEHGPQVHPLPVLSRALKFTPDEKGRVWGVAGVVSNINAATRSLTDSFKKSKTADISAEPPSGGRKFFLQPYRASVNAEGKIQLALKHASAESIALYTRQEQTTAASSSPTDDSRDTPTNYPAASRQTRGAPLLDEDYGRNDNGPEKDPFKSSSEVVRGLSPQSSAAMDKLNVVIGGKPGAIR